MNLRGFFFLHPLIPCVDQDAADALAERIWRARVALNEKRRADEKRAEAARFERDQILRFPMPAVLRRQAD